MIRALWSAATGVSAQERAIDVIANNLANVNTTGFKRSNIHFQDLLYANMKPAGAESGDGNMIPAGIQLGHGVQVSEISKEFSQGSFVLSDTSVSNFDMAISGDGFFQITYGDTVAYTRDGNFSTLGNQNGLFTSSGRPLIGAEGLQGANSLADGYAIIGGNTLQGVQSGGAGVVDGPYEIEIVRFVNPKGLTPIGNNLFLESPASGAPEPVDMATSNTKIMFQNLEQSNVNMVTEMVNMIATQRAYEIGTKAITTADSMLSLVSQLKR